MVREETFGIREYGLHRAAGENTGRGLFILFCEFADASDGAGAILWRGLGSRREKTLHFRDFLRAKHRKQAWNLRLMQRELFSRRHYAA